MPVLCIPASNESDELAALMLAQVLAESGVATYAEPEPAAGTEIGPYAQFAPSLQLIEGGLYWHSDHETSDVVPPTGLAATTRAFARIITEVNGLNLKDLVRPQATETRR